ncbi:MAG: hypothetical protein ACOYL8_02020 [Patescibacteria group bacterium]
MNINLKLDKKKIIIIGSVALIIILIIVFSIVIYQKNKSAENNGATKTEKIFTPDFLSTEEKTKLEIPTEVKIQAMARDKNGKVTVYKVIKGTSDVEDPAKVEPISPRSK